MLWNVIYEFFVKYIFGGFFNGQNYTTYIGQVFVNGSWNSNADLGDVFAVKTSNFYGDDVFITLPNYFSLIATIASMVVILVLCCALIKKIYNMCAHIIG